MSNANGNLTRSELLVIHNELTTKAREILKAKNQDYAHEGDVFRNFRMFGGLGILVRLSDKLARLRSFEENGVLAVADEKLIDTILDLINYSVLYYSFVQESKPEPDPPSNVVAINAPINDGPYCDDCEQLADFVSDDSSVFICANCACEKNVDTTEFCVLEQVG